MKSGEFTYPLQTHTGKRVFHFKPYVPVRQQKQVTETVAEDSGVMMKNNFRKNRHTFSTESRFQEMRVRA
jgi:hypothetical protein